MCSDKHKTRQEVSSTAINYTDEAGWTGGSKRENFSQFSRICEELGIRLINTPSPQAKGSIERASHTYLDRLVPEFHLLGLKSMLDTNRYSQLVTVVSHHL